MLFAPYLKKRILVLEDDPNLRELIVDTLEDEGFLVESAADGRSAYALARKSKFHLLLTDVRIAGEVDGVATMEAIQKILPDVRCVIMTGYADTTVPGRSMKLHADDYVLKGAVGFGARSLLQVVKRVLGRKSLLGWPPFLQGLWQDRTLKTGQAWVELEKERLAAYSYLFVALRSGHASHSQAAHVWNVLITVDQRFLKITRQEDIEPLRQSYLNLQQMVAHGQLESANMSATFARLVEEVEKGQVDGPTMALVALTSLSDEWASQSVETFLLFQRFVKGDVLASVGGDQVANDDPIFEITFGEFSVTSKVTENLYGVTHPVDGDALLAVEKARPGWPEAMAALRLPEEHLAGFWEGETFYRIFQDVEGNDYPSLQEACVPGGLPLKEVLGMLEGLIPRLVTAHSLGLCDGSLYLDRFKVVDDELRIEKFAGLRDKQLRACEAYKRGMQYPWAMPTDKMVWHTAREVIMGEPPSPLSDQFCLAASILRLLLLKEMNVATVSMSDKHGRTVVDTWTGSNLPDPEPLCRMLNANPRERFPSLEEAWSALHRSAR